MKNLQKGSASLALIIILLLVIIAGGVYVYSQKKTPVSAIQNNEVVSERLNGRFVLKDATCAGFEFGNDSSKVIWRNEVECLISDTNPDYYHTQELFWLDSKTFVVKDIERRDQASPPRVDVYVVESNNGKDLTLKSLWTGWGDYKFDTLEFAKK